MDEQIQFYKDTSINFALSAEPGEARLDNEQKLLCEGDFSLNEFYDAVMTLKSNKVPGLDGPTGVLQKVLEADWSQFGEHVSV